MAISGEICGCRVRLGSINYDIVIDMDGTRFNPVASFPKAARTRRSLRPELLSPTGRPGFLDSDFLAVLRDKNWISRRASRCRLTASSIEEGLQRLTDHDAVMVA